MCAQTAKQSITIKKYANRRLYNTATSSYVTLEDLSEMVKEGNQFNVYDAKTSEDITRSVLTQIIVEEENKTDQPNLLPINFLRQLIGFYGDNLQWMVPKYLEHSMEVLTGKQDQIREYFQTSLGNMLPFGTTLEEMGKQNMAMFENTLRMFSPLNAIENFQNNLQNNPFTAMASNMLSSCTNTTTGTTNTPTNATSCKTSSNPTQTKSGTSCNLSSNSSTSCSTTNSKTDTSSTKTSQPMASVTSLKPRNSDTSSSTTTSSTNTMTSTTTTTTPSTPMPNVQSATSSNNNTDDMQQKIANLQRQLADLAKSRA